MPNCMNNVIFLCLYPGWSLCDVKVYEYCDILIFVSRMVSQWFQTVWILWYSYVCVQDGLSVMSNCMNIVIFLCLYPGWCLSDVKYFGILMFVSKMVSAMSNCMNIVIFLCLYPGWPSSDVKLYEYCDILMFVSRIVSLWCQTVWIWWDSDVCLRMVSLWCQSVWILWYSFVCVQDGLSVMSNCMNIMIFLCLYPGWSLWCQTVWILWYSYVCIQDGLSVMSNCMNIMIFLCLCPGWSPSDVKLFEYCDILMFVSRMVSVWCQTVWILWYSYVYVQDGLPVVSNCMNIVIFLFVSRMVSLWCQTVWILWYSCVCLQDCLSVMSNFKNIVIFLCLCLGWSLSDVKLYEYCDILMFVSSMVSQWCQTVWILWYSCLYPGWSLWCQTVWILWYSYVCIQDGLCDVKLYEYCDILMFVSRMVSPWCQTVWILWHSYVCVQDGLPVMSNCMNIVIFLCLYK